jgi:hypothetical protein
MTVSDSPLQWTPETGFGDRTIDEFRAVFLKHEEGGKHIGFPYERTNEVREECQKAGMYYVAFLDDYPMRSRMLFPMNRLAMTLEGDLVDDEKQQPTIAEALQNNEEGQQGSSMQIIQYFLQPFLMETPTLYLLLLAGPKPKYISSIEVLKVYFSVVHMLQASKLPFCETEVFNNALECREFELGQTINFLQGHLFRTSEYQNIFGTLDPTAITSLRQFMVQYTLRTIMIIERFFIRVFAGRLTVANKVLLSTGRVCTNPDEDQRKYLHESIKFWTSEYESLFTQIPMFKRESESFPGYLPPRDSILEKISTNENSDEWFSLYGFWFMLATQYID